MFLELLLTLLLPSADSLMVTMQVWNVYKSLQTNVLDRDNIFFSFNLSFHCSQPNGSFPDDPSYVQWRNRFLLPEFSVSVCIRWKLFLHFHFNLSFKVLRQRLHKVRVNHKHKDGHKQTCPLCQHFNLKLTNKETGFDSMRSEGWEIGCSATACLLTTTSWTYVRVHGNIKDQME